MGIFSEDERSLQNTAILQLIRMKHMVAQLFVQMHKRLVWGENASKLQKKRQLSLVKKDDFLFVEPFLLEPKSNLNANILWEKEPVTQLFVQMHKRWRETLKMHPKRKNMPTLNI